MTNFHYSIGQYYCKLGEHYITENDIVLSKGEQRLCKEHRQVVRTRPRSKKYKALLNGKR